MTRIERVVAAGVFLTALACFTLAGAGTALADYCTFYLHCEGEFPNVTCEQIGAVHCGPYTGDCDAHCDSEAAQCYDQCTTEAGGPAPSCNYACNQVYIACIGSCIPWI